MSPPASPLRLVLASLGFAALTMLWSILAAVSLVAPPPVALGVIALVLTLFLLRHAPPGAGAPAAKRRARSRARRWVRGHGRVAALAALMIPLQISLVTLLMAAGVVDGEEMPKVFTEYLARPWGWTVLVVIVVVVAPVVEEIFFRGQMQGMLERHMGPAAAICVTAALFSAIHFQADGLLNRFVGGVVLGVAVYATRSVWAGVAIHAAWNGGIVGLAALFPDFNPLGKGLAWALPAAVVLALSAGATWWTAARLLAECRGRGRPAPRAATPAALPPLPAAG